MARRPRHRPEARAVFDRSSRSGRGGRADRDPRHHCGRARNSRPWPLPRPTREPPTPSPHELSEDALVAYVADIYGYVECLVISSASTTLILRAIVDDIEREIFEQTGEKPRAVEGLRDASWVLLDFGDLVVHVFLDETREYY